MKFWRGGVVSLVTVWEAQDSRPSTMLQTMLALSETRHAKGDSTRSSILLIEDIVVHGDIHSL